MSANKEDNYLCSVCGKKFSRKSSLVMHSKVHSGDKVCSCLMCKEHCINVSSHKKLENAKKQKQSPHLAIGKPVCKTVDVASKQTSGTKGRAVILNGNLKSKHEPKEKTNKKVISPNKKNSQGSKEHKALGKSHNRKNNVLSKKTTVPENAISKATSANNIVVQAQKTIPSKANCFNKANSGNKKSAFMKMKLGLQRNKTKVLNIPRIVNGRTKSSSDLKSSHNMMMAPTFKNTFKTFCTRQVQYKLENSLRRPPPKDNSKKILVINLSNKTSESKSQNSKVETKVNTELYRCFICGRCYQRKDSVRRHIKKHGDKKLIQGLHCWKVKLERLDK